MGAAVAPAPGGDRACEQVGAEAAAFPVAPAALDGRGDGLLAARPLAPRALVLRCAPLAAMPAGAVDNTSEEAALSLLRDRCCGCLRTASAARAAGGGGGRGPGLAACAACGAARTCGAPRCASLHERECAAWALLSGAGARSVERRKQRRPSRSTAAAGGLHLGHGCMLLLVRAMGVMRGEGGGGDDDWALAPPVVPADGGTDVIVDEAEAAEALVGVEEVDVECLEDSKASAIASIAAQARFAAPAAFRAPLCEWERLAGQLQFNTFAITEDAGSGGGEGGGRNARGALAHAQGRTVGVGLYPSAALLNHSCEPSCAVRFDLAAGAALEVRTTREVDEGEELTIAYIDISRPLAERREKLRKEYAFLCACQRCSREEAEYGSMQRKKKRKRAPQ